MIAERKAIHKIGVIITLILFFIAAMCCFTVEKNTSMGIKIISSEEYSGYTEEQKSDLDVTLLFNDLPAAVDTGTKTVYISQQIDEKTGLNNLKGSLKTDNPNFSVFLVNDGRTESLAETTAAAKGYKLLVVAPDGVYDEYNLIFTDLPVFNMNGTEAGIAANGGKQYSGNIYFFDSNDEQTKNYRSVNSSALWHERGNASRDGGKKPWKLSLKNDKGENADLNFCGMGEDDDWILNPMNLDDVKIREKAVMDLWNTNIASDSTKMSQGKYVEVVFNGEYSGLYMIQRRIDKKFLNLSEDNILLKGASYYPTQLTADYYEIVYSPWDYIKTREYLENNFIYEYCKHMDIESWIDVTLFIQMGCLADNAGEKNIFMLMENVDEDYTVIPLLWDTDMSFGLFWTYKFTYSPENTLYIQFVREEYSDLKLIYPKLDKMLAERWFELRQSVFSEENITETIGNNRADITENGSLQRDIEKWGLYCNGQDTMENLYLFIDMRLEYLDQYYARFL